MAQQKIYSTESTYYLEDGTGPFNGTAPAPGVPSAPVPAPASPVVITPIPDSGTASSLGFGRVIIIESGEGEGESGPPGNQVS